MRENVNFPKKSYLEKQKIWAIFSKLSQIIAK